MVYIYAMSDIHGEIKTFKKIFDSLIKNNLKNNKENKFILLGDYLDRKNRDTKILTYIKNIQNTYKIKL